MVKLDTEFYKPFVDGAIKTLNLQCHADTKPEEPFVKGTKPQPRFELAGVIGITSSAFNGTITLCFPKQVFLTLMSNMLGETFTDITDDLQSGAAELLNIIFGSAKAVLNEQGHTIQKAIPTVIKGDSIQTTHLGTGTVMVLPFAAAGGHFHIEVSTEDAGMK